MVATSISMAVEKFVKISVLAAVGRVRSTALAA